MTPVLLLLVLVGAFLSPAFLLAQSDYDLFTEAKILIFDKKWKQAQAKLDELLEGYPDSRYYAQAMFYKGKCLAEQKGKEAEALAVYNRFLRQKDAESSLMEEAENSIIDLAITLFLRGKRSYLDQAEERLRSPDRGVRYYAAIQLSFVKDPQARERALPVLHEILEESRDNELRDRAKLAILRIDPDAYEDIDEDTGERQARIMYIRIYKEGRERPALKLNIPWALADLAFSAISDEDKVRLRRKGYDLDRIVRQLLVLEGEVLEIYDEDDGVIFRIWIR